MVQQKDIILPAFGRGFHLITDIIVDELHGFADNGLLHVFIRHTSAGLTINENYDPSVRDDLESSFNNLVPENTPYYTHTMEGSDDMPAHIKSSLVGSSLSIPIKSGRLCLGTWQGIYLCEFRNRGGTRKLTLTFIS